MRSRTADASPMIIACLSATSHLSPVSIIDFLHHGQFQARVPLMAALYVLILQIRRTIATQIWSSNLMINSPKLVNKSSW